MKFSYTWEEIERWRDKVHRRKPGLAVRSQRKALEFVNQMGFCFAFKSENSELPSLWHAACGQRHPIMPEHTHSDPAISFVWEMKDVLPAEKKIYYGKVLKRRPTMVSLDFFAYFYVLAHRTGEPDEFRREFLRGNLSSLARDIMEALDDSWPQVTKGLKLAVGKHRPSDRKAFDNAITELQMKMFIAKVAERRNPFTFEWAPVHEVYRGQVRKAARITQDVARDRILAQYFQIQLVGTVHAIHHLFGWEKQSIFRSLGNLIQKGIITPNIRVDGRDSRYYALVQ